MVAIVTQDTKYKIKCCLDITLKPDIVTQDDFHQTIIFIFVAVFHPQQHILQLLVITMATINGLPSLVLPAATSKPDLLLLISSSQGFSYRLASPKVTSCALQGLYN